MTSRERVTAALKFGNPDRIPVDLQVLPAAYLRHGSKMKELLKKHPIDFDYPQWKPEEIDPRYRAGRYEDEWGCVWENKTEGFFGLVVKHPLEDYRMLKTFRPPVDNMKDIAGGKFSRDPDKYSPETTRDTSSGMTQKLWYLFTNPFMGDMITGGEFKLKEIKNV